MQLKTFSNASTQTNADQVQKSVLVYVKNYEYEPPIQAKITQTGAQSVQTEQDSQYLSKTASNNVDLIEQQIPADIQINQINEKQQIQVQAARPQIPVIAGHDLNNSALYSNKIPFSQTPASVYLQQHMHSGQFSQQSFNFQYSNQFNSEQSLNKISNQILTEQSNIYPVQSAQESTQGNYQPFTNNYNSNNYQNNNQQHQNQQVQNNNQCQIQYTEFHQTTNLLQPQESAIKPTVRGIEQLQPPEMNFELYEPLFTLFQPDLPTPSDSFVKQAQKPLDFNGQVLQMINDYFKTNFSLLKEAIVHYRKMSHKSRIQLNFKALGEMYNMNQETAYNRFLTVQQTHLDSWDQDEIALVKEVIKRKWMLYQNEDPKERIWKIRKELNEELKLEEQFEKNYKQINNIINYQLTQLKK
ncbi:Hypothetical_protein [Hexamita inflata]|uniref:Hypothetical_protein n=1 Tax=Hexamita inflata TaxID=28002 RepID=A0AA86US82_9EUKA|nr:Hypothetical protein HINF_LOCUS50311 [Hexamita inflata]